MFSFFKLLLFILAVTCVCSAARKPILSRSFKRSAVEGSVIFTPHSLPCSYHIILYTEEYEDGELTDCGYEHAYVNDDQLYYDSIETAGESYLLRHDGKKYYLYHFSLYQGCDDDEVSKDSYKESFEGCVGVYVVKTIYDNVKDSEFNGTKCKEYYVHNEEQGKKGYFYVNDDDYIIGTKIADDENEGTYTIYSVSYEMEASAEDVVMNAQYTGCPEEAYTVPEDHLCGSSAVALKTSLLLVISLIIISLF